MQKHEFETLTGMTVDEVTFQHADDIYMNAGSLTKQDVCKEIKEHPWMLESKTIAQMAVTASDYNRKAARLQVEVEKLKAALLDAATLAADPVLWKHAKELIGAAKVIRYKLGNEIDLEPDDVEYICENIQ